MHSRIINLSKNNELSIQVEGMRGAEKYKIIKNYILKKLDTKIIFNNGMVATIDDRDAMHIAHKAGNKKTAAIFLIKEIIENSKYIAFEKSDNGKYDIFFYYSSKIFYENEIHYVYINVGRTRNNQGNKIYDITFKLRESAHRINDVERL